jgi:hypothetical protein
MVVHIFCLDLIHLRRCSAGARQLWYDALFFSLSSALWYTNIAHLLYIRAETFTNALKRTETGGLDTCHLRTERNCELRLGVAHFGIILLDPTILLDVPTSTAQPPYESAISLSTARDAE